MHQLLLDQFIQSGGQRLKAVLNVCATEFTNKVLA